MLVSYEYSHALNGFKQVQIAYLAGISYLDSYSSLFYQLHTIYTHQPKDYAQKQQLLRLISSEIILLSHQEG